MKVHSKHPFATQLPGMHSWLRPSTRRLCAVAARTAGVVLLTPLIVLAGLIALVALTAMITSRQTSLRQPDRRRVSSVVPVRLLEAVSAESSLGMAGRRAA